jgi:hypothetical protein
MRRTLGTARKGEEKGRGERRRGRGNPEVGREPEVVVDHVVQVLWLLLPWLPWRWSHPGKTAMSSPLHPLLCAPSLRRVAPRR